jgi:hypothetical protein
VKRGFVDEDHPGAASQQCIGGMLGALRPNLQARFYVSDVVQASVTASADEFL